MIKAKKVSVIFLSAVVCLSLAACGKKSAIQEATGASTKQAQAIETAIADAGIRYETIHKTTKKDSNGIYNPNAYDLLDKDGNEYFLILDSKSNLLLILDNNGYALYESPSLQTED